MTPALGDRFSVPLPDGGSAVGRVLLDVARQCTDPQLVEAASPLAYFKRALLVEVEGRLPGVFVDGDAFASGAFPIVGRAPVDPSAVEPPPAILVVRRRPVLAWGELLLPLEMTVADAEELHLRPAIWPSARLGEAYVNPSLLGASDARLHPARARVEAALGGPLTGYVARARREGSDWARFYPRPACKHCLAPLSPDAAGGGRCATCGRPTGAIALSVEAERGARRTCPSCGAVVLHRATVCRHCRADLPEAPRLEPTPGLRLVYQSGSNESPFSPFGRVTLTVDGEGRAQLDALRGTARWEGRVAAATLRRFLSHLRDAAFPIVDDHRFVPDTMVRELTLTVDGSTETARVAWNEASNMVGYAAAFDLLDAIVRQLSDGTITFRPDTQPAMVEEARRVV